MKREWETRLRSWRHDAFGITGPLWRRTTVVSLHKGTSIRSFDIFSLLFTWTRDRTNSGLPVPMTPKWRHSNVWDWMHYPHSLVGHELHMGEMWIKSCLLLKNTLSGQPYKWTANDYVTITKERTKTRVHIFGLNHVRWINYLVSTQGPIGATWLNLFALFYSSCIFRKMWEALFKTQWNGFRKN